MNLFQSSANTPRDPTSGNKLGFPSETLARAFCAKLSELYEVPERKVEELCHRARWLGEPITNLVLREGILSGTQLRDSLSAISGIPTISLAEIRVAPEAVERVPVTTVSRCRIMPLLLRKEHIVLACDRIVSHSETEQLHVLLGCPIKWALCLRMNFRKASSTSTASVFKVFLILKRKNAPATIRTEERKLHLGYLDSLGS